MRSVDGRKRLSKSMRLFVFSLAMVLITGTAFAWGSQFGVNKIIEPTTLVLGSENKWISMPISKAISNDQTAKSKSVNEVTFTAPLFPGKPDLVVKNINILPIFSKTGDKVTFRINYENRGTSTTGDAPILWLYLDDDLIEKRSLMPLEARSSKNIEIPWKVKKEILDGSHTLYAYLDQDKSGSYDYIDESIESNNVVTASLYITRLLPDLTIENIFWRPAKINNGDLVTFTVNYANIGDLCTDDDATIWLYIDNSLIKKMNIGLLTAGERGSVEIPWTAAKDLASGEHDIDIFIDRDEDNRYNTILESNEQNNAISKALTTGRIDAKSDLTIIVKDNRTSDPIESAEVFIDGNNRGRTNSRGELTAKVTEGMRHIIETETRIYSKSKKEIYIGYDSKPLSIPLFLEYGMAHVTLSVKSESGTIIKNAEILCDDGITGKTDVNGEFKIESRKDSIVRVKIKKPAYIPFGPIDVPVGRDDTKQPIILKAMPRPIIGFSSTNTVANVGNRTIFLLNVLNPIGAEDVTVQLVIKPPPGVSVDETYYAKLGGALYYNTEPLAPGQDAKIVLGMVGNEVGDYTISANVSYYYGTLIEDKLPELNETLSLHIEPSPSKQEPRPGIPGFEAVFLITSMIVASNVRGLRSHSSNGNIKKQGV